MTQTIHTWDSPERPHVLIDLRRLSNPLFVRVSGPEDLAFTTDPEGAEVMTEKAARVLQQLKVGDARLAAIPYDLAAALYGMSYDISELRAEYGSAQAVIKDAALAVDHGEGEAAKLSLEVETLEPHEGVGQVAYFSIDPRYVVVEKTLFDALDQGARQASQYPGIVAAKE